MGRHYGHLTLEERCTIAQLHQAGQSVRQIAAALDRSPSSISRDLKRNSGTQVGYKPSYAAEQAATRRWSGSRLERDAELRTLVLDQLRRGWSPGQIAGRLKQQRAPVTISHESIYRFIYAQIRRTTETPPREVMEQGVACLRALPEMPLYARVGGVVRAGMLIVIEVEVLEPALFMEFDPPSAERFAEATLRRLRRDLSP